MTQTTKLNKINKLLFFLLLPLLVAFGPFGCIGGGGIGGGLGIGNFLGPVNEASGEKNTGGGGGGDLGGGDDGSEGSGGDQASGSGSPNQPGNEGMGKPHPRGGGEEPGTNPGGLNPGGTIATGPSPVQPYQEGVGKGGILYKFSGKVRPPALADAECVEFSSAPALTILWRDPADGQWKPDPRSTPFSSDACGNFVAMMSFSGEPYSVKVKAVFGYQGVMYETVSEEISFASMNPGSVVPPNDPVLETEDPLDRFPRYHGPSWNDGLPNGTFNP